MTSPTTPTSAGLVSMLAWMIPLGGILIWVFILPSTRALLRLKAEAFSKKRSSTAPESVETPAGTAGDKPPAAPRLRSEDPEIMRFDREVVRRKFHSSTPETARTE